MKNKKTWMALLTGGVIESVGVFGLSICCLPVAASFPGILGLIAIFSYSYSRYLLIAGAILLLLSIFLFIRSRKCKHHN